MRNPGKIAIFVLLGVGLAAALFSLWYHRQGARRALEFWGTDAAVLIARAPRIEALRLGPAEEVPARKDRAGDEPQRRIEAGGRLYPVTGSEDASSAPGISNIRRAIIIDPPYEWEESGSAEPAWQYALEFLDGGQTTIVLFDFDSRQIGSTGGRTAVVLRPPVADDWRSFFAERFEQKSDD